MTFRAKGLTIRAGEKVLLCDADLEIAARELTVLVGKSGGGKSSLLRVLAGLEPQADSEARIFWTGHLEWNDDQAIPLRSGQTLPRVGLVFQQPALLDEWSALQNVQLAIDHREAIDPEGGSSKDHDSANWWLEHLDVPQNVPISRLSGGQRQRLNLAQVLAAKPQLLFYDEPTTGLDVSTAQKVASLIQKIQQEEQITSIVVTHDFASFLPISQNWLVLHQDTKKVEASSRESIQREWDSISLSLASSLPNSRTSNLEEPKKLPANESVPQSKWSALPWNGLLRAFEKIGSMLEQSLMGVLGLFPRFRRWQWGWRFIRHYANLVFGWSGILYLGIAGAIVGFVATYFTLRYMPYKIYTEPLLMEELIGVIGFALYRILIPVVTCLLVAARCSAAVSADLGAKAFGGQIENLRLLRVAPEKYLLTPVLWAFLVGTCFLNFIAFVIAKWTSLFVFVSLQPGLGADFWHLYFHLPMAEKNPYLFDGSLWLHGKLLLSALGTGLVTFRLAMQPKLSGRDVSRGITSTILWSTLWVLLIHMLFAFFEFSSAGR